MSEGAEPPRATPPPVRSALALPAAIVVAGALVGAGLYLGLRERAPRQPMRVEWNVGPPPSGAASQAPSASSPGDDVREAVHAAAVEALAARQPALRSACWEPSVARAAEPATATFRVRLTFDADGRQVAFGVADPDAASRRDVAACLRDAGVVVSVPAPGRRIGTELQLAFP